MKSRYLLGLTLCLITIYLFSLVLLHQLAFQVAALLTLAIIMVINLAIGIFPHVDNFASIGGFITGFLLGFVLLARPQFGWMEPHDLPQSTQVGSKYKAHQYILWVIALLLAIAG